MSFNLRCENETRKRYVKKTNYKVLIELISILKEKVDPRVICQQNFISLFIIFR